MSTKLKLMGVDVASIGDAHGTTPNSRSYTYVNDREEVYKKIVVSEDDKYLLGAVLIGGTLLNMVLYYSSCLTKWNYPVNQKV